MNSAPGISIEAVLSSAPEQALRGYIGSSTINILRALNPKELSRKDLINLAVHAADPWQVLKNQKFREQIIQLLPTLKAQELANNIGLQAQGTALYAQLVKAFNRRDFDTQLFLFFGVTIPERSPYYHEKSEKKILPQYSLFPYQQLVAKRALFALEEHPYTTVVHMPTGSGKTRTAMHIISNILNKNPNKLVIWLAQTSELLEQAASEFERAWSSLGSFPTTVYRYWGSYNPNIMDARSGFLVAGLGKLNALYKRNTHNFLCLGDRAILTVIDEAHQAIAPTYKLLIDLLKSKKPTNALLGLTATPGRTWADINVDATLSAFFGHHKVMLEIEGYSNPITYLIENGYLANPTFKTLNIESGIELTTKDLQELADIYEIPPAILDQIACSDKRNIRIITTIENLKDKHKRIIVFAATVNHAYLISSILNIRGTKSFVVTGDTDQTTREIILRKFKSETSEPLILCNYGVLTTGFDAPKTNAAVIARPTKSLVLYSQMVGRALRGEKAGGNKNAEIITVVDPELPGFGDIAAAFTNWEDVWTNED